MRNIFFFLVGVVVPMWAGAQNPVSDAPADYLFGKGYSLAQHANFGAAREVFSEFLRIAPGNDSRRGEATYWIAYSALRLTHLDGEKLMVDFVENFPSNPYSGSAYYDLANYFQETQQYTKAIHYYRKADFPSLSRERQYEGHFKWGYAHFSQKEFDEALDHFSIVKSQSNAYGPAASYYSGYIEFGKGQYENAMADLKRAEKNESYSPIVPYLIASILYRQALFDELIAYGLELSSRSNVSNAKEISMLVADAYYFKKEYGKANASYEKYLADNPDKAESVVLFRAGYSLYSLKQIPQAIEYLKRSAASHDTVSHFASYYLGILYLGQGNKPYALNSFDHARKHPLDIKLREEGTFQYAKIAYDLGKPDLSIREFETFLQQYPSSVRTVQVKELLAQAYINGNNFNKAIEYIESLPHRNGTIDQAYQKATYLKGAELFNKEDYPGAVALFEKSLQYPIDAQFVVLSSFWCGESYSLGQRFDQSIQHYQRAIGQGKPETKDIALKSRYALAYSYYNLKQYDKALPFFRDFVNMGGKNAPNFADALIRLADCYYISKSYEEAQRHYAQARVIGSPDNDYVLLQSATLAGIQRKYSEARELFKEMIKGYPKSQYRDEAMYQWSLFELEEGNNMAAIANLSQLISENPNSPFVPYAYSHRASSYYNLKQFEKAVDDYSTVIKRFPAHPAAQESLLPLQEALNISGKASAFDEYLAVIKKADPTNQNLEKIEFESAKNHYFNQNYPQAITGLSAFIQNYPQSPLLSEARFYRAETYYRTNDLDRALIEYTGLLSVQGFSSATRVLNRLAEINFRKGEYPKAILFFKELEKSGTNKKELFVAWSGLMESYYMLSQYDSVPVYANQIITKGNVNVSASNKATLYLGKALMAKGDFEGAKDEFLNTLNTARDEYGAEAKYLLGYIFYQGKAYKQCYETLIGLNTDFASYEHWVGKAFLLLADNFMAMGDAFQAKATLQSLIDHFPIQQVKEEAKGKLIKIQEGEAQKQVVDSLESN